MSQPIEIASRPMTRTPSGLGAALVAMAGLAVAMGFGRFAYTPILPLMIEAHLLPVTEGSALAGINLAGYLLGALVGIRFAAHARALLAVGMILTALSLAAMAFTGNTTLWFVFRGLSGIASAWALIGLSNWAMASLAKADRLALRGLAFSGPGVGIAVSGIAVPVLHRAGVGVAGLWLALGIASAMAALWIIAETTAGPDDTPAARPPITAPGRRFSLAKAALVLSYGLGGFGYITTASFLPLIAHERIHGGLAEAALWPTFGLAAAVVATAFGLLPTRHNALLLALAYAVQGLGVIAPVVLPPLAGLIASSGLVGATLMLISMLAFHEAKTRFDDPALVALLTAAYAFGQMTGPYVAGFIYARSHSFLPALTIAGAGLGIAALLTLVERGLRRAERLRPAA